MKELSVNATQAVTGALGSHEAVFLIGLGTGFVAGAILTAEISAKLSAYKQPVTYVNQPYQPYQPAPIVAKPWYHLF